MSNVERIAALERDVARLTGEVATLKLLLRGAQNESDIAEGWRKCPDCGGEVVAEKVIIRCTQCDYVLASG